MEVNNIKDHENNIANLKDTENIVQQQEQNEEQNQIDIIVEESKNATQNEENKTIEELDLTSKQRIEFIYFLDGHTRVQPYKKNPVLLQRRI